MRVLYEQSDNRLPVTGTDRVRNLRLVGGYNPVIGWRPRPGDASSISLTPVTAPSLTTK